MVKDVALEPGMDKPSWRQLPDHRQWLRAQVERLFDFYQYRSIDPSGGFWELDAGGRPVAAPRQLHATTRMVHCFAIAQLLRRPGASTIVDHGMQFLWNGHRDRHHGGYVWSLDRDGRLDKSKQAYGHAFVLLAAASAKCVGHPLADNLLSDVSAIIGERFWEEEHGAVAEEFSADWTPLSDYRGQNANMHLTEALMAAFEATGEADYLRKAERIASLVIARHAAALDYRVAEHFNSDWSLKRDYRGSDIFRPAGLTPGHWLEWARLLMQLWALSGRREAWMPNAAKALFASAVASGWDHERGGFYYTLDFDDTPVLRQKLWWPLCEAIGAAVFLSSQDEAGYETWYRTFWEVADRHFIDHEHGGWLHELDETMRPAQTLFAGKPDIYHALQACLIPLYPTTGSLTKVIRDDQATPRT